jgi:hypothetical protein
MLPPSSKWPPRPVVLWTARDNMTSGVRFLTNSQAATTRVLGALGRMLENLNQDPALRQHDNLSANWSTLPVARCARPVPPG